MAFLLNNEQSFIVVDTHPRQGIFCQFYNQGGFSRPIQIQPTVHSNYSATLDSLGTLHIVSQNNKNQVSHFSYLNGHYTKQIILEDPTESYKFSNLSLHYFNNALHLFYVACTPVGSSYALIHQILDSDKIETLLELPSPQINLKIFNTDDLIYIFYIENNNDFTLKCITLSSSNTNQFDVLTSTLPIKDYAICLDANSIHIVYEKEIYGKYQLLYTNTTHRTEQLFSTNVISCMPCIFSYSKGMWVTYLEDGTLKARLSIDNGNLFSMPIATSLQENVLRYNYYSGNSNSLNANSMYAASNNLLRLAVVASLDTEGIHPDIKHNIELELLLDGMSITQNIPPTEDITPILEENRTLKEAVTKLSELNKQLYERYNMVNNKVRELPTKPPEQTHTSQADTSTAKPSIQSAATAFMQEMNQWELPPSN
ncbi:MAG: hypothetical protein AB9856_09150 [Cellulosilyticaceae bacterium]